MSDLIETQLREAFMALRDEMQEELTPPGPDAAQETVARRRRARTATAVLVMALAAVGGLVALRPDVPDTADATAPTTTTLDPTRLQELARQMARVSPEVTQPLPGLWAAPVPSAPAEHVFGGDGQAAFPAGRYTYLARCAGQGSTTFEWYATTAPQPRDGQFLLTCRGDVSEYTGSIDLAQPGQIRFRVQGDDVSPGRAAFAVMLTDPRSVAALAELESRPETVVTVSDDTSHGAVGFGHSNAPPGRYRLALVCVGSGTLRVSVEPVAEPVEHELVCEPAGATIEFEATTTDAGALYVNVAEQTGRAGEAGFAYRLDHLG